MGRKATPEPQLADTYFEAEPTQAARPVPRATPRGLRDRRPKRSVWNIVRLMMFWFAAVIGAGLMVITYLQVDRFLNKDPRFTLAMPSERGGDSPGIEIKGLHRLPSERISQLFERDYGRSLFRLPIAQRREELLRVDWVKDATISRIWPNQLRISIVERVPVAFVSLPTPSGTSTNALIDADGVFLSLPENVEFQLPVLTGTSPEESLTLRRRKIQRAMQVLKEIGPYAEKISEIDLLSLDNIRITEQIQDRAYTLWLGSKNFLTKLQYVDNYFEEIQRHHPNATVIDLRIDGRINTGSGGRSGR